MSEAARPDYMVSGLLAAAVHLALLVFLIMGVSWNRKPPEPVSVELWRDVPVAPPPKPVSVAPPKAVEPPPPAPKPAPPPEPKPVAAPQPKPVVPPKPADIALQEKREKEKKLREEKAAEAAKAKDEERKRLEDQKQREEEQKQRAAEQKRADEQRKREDEARRREEEAQRKETEKRNREALLERQMKAQEEQRLAKEAAEAERRAAAQAAARAQKQIDEYTARIRDAIRDKVTLPPGIDGNPQAEFEVKLLKNGTVAAVRLTRSSGAPAYDRAVERAIELAQPLPIPDDMEIFQQMRDLKLLFRPRD